MYVHGPDKPVYYGNVFEWFGLVAYFRPSIYNVHVLAYVSTSIYASIIHSERKGFSFDFVTPRHRMYVQTRAVARMLC